MSRIANSPVEIPKGVEVSIKDRTLSVKGDNGNLSLDINELVDIRHDGDRLKFSAVDDTKKSGALTGTFRALVNNMMKGVTVGFMKQLQLVGVGYRAQLQGKKLSLSLGFSHPVAYDVPDGVELEAISQTELHIKGSDKQLVGQVAAEIRAFRPPEPYKGKGIRYMDEYVKRKDAKKK